MNKQHKEVLEEMEKETLTLCKLTGKEHPRVKALRYAIDILGRVEKLKKRELSGSLIMLKGEPINEPSNDNI